ncbi:MAG: mandelate racemase, partial [bacterium]|nr:mandelate racemase [bacterium]
MTRDLKITRIVVTSFAYEITDLELEASLGFDTVYRKGGRLASGGSILRIETDAGVAGEAPGGIDARSAR